jgi:NitT/TauT family transport system substrate-binding protein
LIADGLQPSELQVFHYGDFGVALLQDGLYAMQDALADPVRSDALVRFLKASVQGWKYAVAHQDEAVTIILENEKPAIAADVATQTRMMSTVARLTESGLQSMGYLEPAAFNRVVQILLAAGPPPPITQPPSGAWTHDIWQRASR